MSSNLYDEFEQAKIKGSLEKLDDLTAEHERQLWGDERHGREDAGLVSNMAGVLSQMASLALAVTEMQSSLAEMSQTLAYLRESSDQRRRERALLRANRLSIFARQLALIIGVQIPMLFVGISEYRTAIFGSGIEGAFYATLSVVGVFGFSLVVAVAATRYDK